MLIEGKTLLLTVSSFLGLRVNGDRKMTRRTKLRDRKKAVLIVLILLTAAAGILAAFSFFMEKNRSGNEKPAQGITGEGSMESSANPAAAEGTVTESVTTSDSGTAAGPESAEDSGTTSQSVPTEPPESTANSEPAAAASELTESPDVTANSEPAAAASVPEAVSDPVPETSAESPVTGPQAQSKIIAVDPGHQKKGNYEKEPVGPGASETKAKVASGTQGVSSKVPEYELTLAVSLKLKEELINRGYEVVMIRETNDVDISNKERADIAGEAGADALIRVHADGSENQSVSGATALYPSDKNPYVAYLSADSKLLSEEAVNHLCLETGAKNRGISARDDMSGINWCTVPVTIIEIGFMTNPEEDEKLQTAEYQDKIVEGLCNGIDAYFEKKE